MEKNALKPTEEGTPQGGICSPVLANLTLDGLEKVLRERFSDTTRSSRKARSKVHLVRYADDFIVTGRSKELLENEAKPLVEQFLRERGLTLSQEKTHVVHIKDGFDFLGQNVRKYNEKLLIKPSKKSIQTHLDTIRRKIKENKTATAGHLITLLNPVLQGWANYHRHVVSSKVFQQVDTAVFKAVWRWAKRRHPNKGKQWIKKKYFKTVDNRNWVFFGLFVDKQGFREVELVSTSSIKIRRHHKIRKEANPYDPRWEEYFEKRLDVHMEANLKGKRKLLALWKQQKGLCPSCNQKITSITGWQSHSIVWRSKGGSDGQENRVLLHPECHRKVHSQR